MKLFSLRKSSYVSLPLSGGGVCRWLLWLGLFVGWVACAERVQAAPPVGDLLLVDGEVRPARLLGVDSEWQLKFGPLEGDAPEWSMPVADIVAWGKPASDAGVGRLLFHDGGQLVGTLIGSDGDSVQVNSPLLGSVSVPLELLHGILVHPPRDVQRADRLIVRILSMADHADSTDSTAGADRVILENGDELTGTVVEIDAKKLRLEAAVGMLEVDTKGVVAIGFDPSLMVRPKPEPGRVLVGLKDGTCVTASQLNVDPHSVRLTLANLKPIAPGPATAEEMGWLAPANSVVFLQPLDGRVVYLSDLKASSYRHVPYLTLPWHYAVDRNVGGTLLRGGQRRYVKGISMHSTSRLTYRLDGEYRRFEALAAIDDSTGGRGSVTFRVFVDGQQRYASPIVRGGQPPVPIRVDVSEGQELSLIVDFADAGDELDRANWLDARLVK